MLLRRLIGSAFLAVLLSAPVLRLRGDYFALVTLGFGEVVRFTLRNLEEITAGTKGLKPIPSPEIVPFDLFEIDWSSFRRLLLADAERSSHCRFVASAISNARHWPGLDCDCAKTSLRPQAWDSTSPVSSWAQSPWAPVSPGLAGCLFAFVLRNTSDPDQYGFNVSIITLCCLILGGVGNRAGVILGVFLIFGFDNLLSPIADSYLQHSLQHAADPSGEVRLLGMRIGNTGSPYLNFSGWRLAVFGMALILVMRFRPSGLIPARRGVGEGS